MGNREWEETAGRAPLSIPYSRCFIPALSFPPFLARRQVAQLTTSANVCVGLIPASFSSEEQQHQTQQSQCPFLLSQTSANSS